MRSEVSNHPAAPDLETEAFSTIGEVLRGVFAQGPAIVLWLVVTASFCLVVNGSWNASPDSALYLALGESLARGEGYVFNGEPHTFVPPGFPLMLAFAAHVWGADFLSYRILMAAMGLLTAFAGYLLIARLCGKDAGLLVGGVFALNHVLLDNSSMILADVPFALFSLVALHCLLSASAPGSSGAWLFIAAVATGLLPLIRINGMAMPALGALFMWCARNECSGIKRAAGSGLFLIVAYIPAIAWQVWKSSFPVSFGEGTYLDAVATRQISDQLSVVFGSLFNYFEETSYALTGLSIRLRSLEFVVPILAALGLVQAIRNGDRLLAPVTAVQYAGLLLAAAGSRYLIFLIPGLYLFLAMGLLWTADRVSWVRQRVGARALLVVVFGALALFNGVHNLKTIYQARTPLETGGAQSADSAAYFACARWLKANAAGRTVLTTRPRIIHYLSGCRTVPLLRSGVPDHEVWVQSREPIQRLLLEHKPDFLFADWKMAALYDQVFKAADGLGIEVSEVTDASIDNRYRLYRLDYELRRQ